MGRVAQSARLPFWKTKIGKLSGLGFQKMAPITRQVICLTGLAGMAIVTLCASKAIANILKTQQNREDPEQENASESGRGR